MSFLAFPSYLTQAQAPLNPEWITPEEQLERLYLPLVEKIVGSLSILDVAKLVAKYVGLDASVTNWYTALKRLNSLPKKIPPLTNNIYQILEGRCPIYGDQMKKVKDTHFLSLIPKEFGNVNRLEKEILKPYGERHYPKENPLQFRYFRVEARQQHAEVPFPETQWGLMSNNVLPGSRNRMWIEQVALVDALSQRAFVDYEIPTLQQSFASITTDMVATGERRYRAGDTKNGNVFTYTRVKEMTQGYHLVFGGFATDGVLVNFDHVADFLGIAVFRRP